MKFVVATKNQKKLAELQRILAPLGATVLSEKDLAAPLQEVVEDADSFCGNALLKARAAVKQTGCAAIADDSGMCVDYLNGAPGIFSARYAGAGHNDEANNQTGRSLPLRGAARGTLPWRRRATAALGTTRCFAARPAALGN